MVNRGSSKKSTKSSSKHCNLKVLHTTKYFAKCSFFSSQIYHKAIFYTAYFYANLMLLNLNTVRTLIEMKLNLLHCIFFRQDFQSRKLISFRLCEVLDHFLYLSYRNRALIAFWVLRFLKTPFNQVWSGSAIVPTASLIVWPRYRTFNDSRNFVFSRWYTWYARCFLT